MCRRPVPPFVVAFGEIVDSDEQGQYDDHARGRKRSEPGIAARKRSRDITPLTEDVKKRTCEPGQRERPEPLPFRLQLRNRERGAHERHAKPTDESQNSFEHDCVTRASVPCRLTWRSGTG